MKIKRENLLLIIGMVIILGTHLVGCEKIPLPPPLPPPVVEPEELAPTLELTVTPEGVIPYGDVAQLKWKTTNALRLFINDERQDDYREGNKGTGRLFKETTFVVKAVNVKLSTTEIATIKVGPWYETTFGLVSYFPWRYKEFRVSSVNGVIMSTIYLTEEELSWIFYYHRDGRKTYSPNLSSDTSQWYLKDDSTIVVNGTDLKLQVNQEEMIISYEVTYNGTIQ